MADVRIDRLRVPDGYQWLVPEAGSAAAALREACGTRQGSSWTAPAFALLTTDDDGSALCGADCPWIGRHVLAVREAARAAAETVLVDQGEFLALAADDVVFYAFNALRTLDALDEDRSAIVRGRRSGSILDIEAYALRDGTVPRRAVFRLPQEPAGMFFTEDVADDLLALGLTGLRLESVTETEPAA